MVRKNDWHKSQKREGGKFQPKWDKEIVTLIIQDINKRVDYVDTQYGLCKRYGIGMRTARSWIEMSKRIMKDMQNGLSMDEAMKRDKERRTLMRRRKYE